MIDSSLAALLMGTASIASPISAEFVGKDFNDAQNAIYERYDVRLTNTADEQTQLSVCPPDSKLLINMPDWIYRKGTYSMTGFAVGFDGEPWGFNCVDRQIAAGESVTVSIFFRSFVERSNRRFGRSVLLSTSLGDFFIREGEVTRLEASAES